MTPRELYYDVAKTQIASQDAQHRDLEAKTIRLTAANIAIVGLVITLMQSTGTQITESWWLITASAVMALLVLSSTSLTLAVLWPRAFHIKPDICRFAEHLEADEALGGEHWTWWVGRSLRRGFLHNEAIIEGKARLIFWNQIVATSQVVPALCLTAAALIP